MGANRKYEAVVIGVSAGGLTALNEILPALSSAFRLPVLVVQHISPSSDSYLPVHFSVRIALRSKEAEDKEPILGGTIFFAPPNYHMMVECDRTIALSVDPKVNFSRPAIDVLFETAAETYRDRLIGVVLTGGNSDGARGLARIKELGGLAIVQSPGTAEAQAMPLAAIEATKVDHVLPLDRIGSLINSICTSGDNE